MTELVSPAVIVAKSLTLLLGGLITYYSLRAYQRTGSRALRALGVGFGAVTAGALLAGIVDQLLPVQSALALVVEGVFTVSGFAIILYSLYVD